MIFGLLTFLQTQQSPGGGWSFPLVMVLMFVAMWFFMIRPQQKKQKQLKEMRKTLAKGDKIISQGGIFGVIIDVKDTYFLVEVDANVKIRIAKDLVYKDLSELPQQK